MRQKPRILIVTESLGYGGTESHLLAVLPRIAASGFKIAVFCLTERGERADILESAGVEVIASAEIARSKRSALRYPLHLLVAGAKLFIFARSWRPDIAHFFLPGPYFIGAPSTGAARVPNRIMSRRSLSDYQQNWRGSAQLERLLHAKMDLIIGNCRTIVRELEREGVPKSKLRLIYNGIEDRSIKIETARAREILGVDASAFVGVTVANLIPYKGHHDLIEALAIAAPQLGTWQFLCVGRDDGLGEELATLAEARGIGANVRFLGQRSDIPCILAAADLGVLPSYKNEGFSNAILESMQAGIPMIVTDTGGNAEAVTDGETGIVVPPSDPVALASAVLQLARDSSLRRRLGESGRHRVATLFSLEECVTQYCDLYNDLLAAKKGAQNAERKRASG
jgi:glycosyltransferase involved in cell wall biosynthesis